MKMGNVSQSVKDHASAGVQQATPKGLEAELTLLLKGLDAVIPDGTSVTMAGKNLTKDALKAELQQGLDLFQAVHRQVGATKSSRLALSQALPQVRQEVRAFRDALVGLLGRGNPLLEQLGIRVHAGAIAMTAEQKALRVQKLRATRAARHTMGKRQRKSVVGTLPAASTAPVATVPSSGNAGVSGSHGAA
jgi:hypothetical protein